MRHVSRLLTAATLVAATVSVAACGSSSSGSSPASQASQAASPSPSGGSTTGTLCSLTTKDEVSAVIGKPAAESPSVNTAKGCSWPTASGTATEKLRDDASLSITRTYPDASQSAKAVADEAAHGCAPTTPQMGDGSCLFSASSQSHATVLFAKGNSTFFVSCTPATVAALLTWAQAVAGRA